MWKTSNPHSHVPIVLDQHVIAMNGLTEILRQLCEQQRIDIDAQDSTDSTYLFSATEVEHAGTTGHTQGGSTSAPRLSLSTPPGRSLSVALRTVGVLGIAGPEVVVDGALRSLLVQLASIYVIIVYLGSLTIVEVSEL